MVLLLLVSAVMADEQKKEATPKEKRGVLGLGYPGEHYSHGAVIGAPHVSSVTITKEVPVGIPQPYAVPVVKHVPVPVKVNAKGSAVRNKGDTSAVCRVQ